MGHWSTGNAEDSLQSRGVSIRVPSTTLSDIGLDLYQQHVRGSQPRAPPVQLIFQGPFTLSWAFRHSFLRHQAIHNTPGPASPSSPSHPAPKELVGPTGLLQPGPPSRTTCCAPKSRPFASAPARGHGQGQKERERRSEEGGSVPGPPTFLVVSPGAHGTKRHGCIT